MPAVVWISQKTTDKLENKISNFAELEHEKSLLKRNQRIFKANLMISAELWIMTNRESNLLRKEVEEYRQQIKSSESEKGIRAVGRYFEGSS